ncbi:MAG TPA: cyclopropane-fatty-acyl-phospholipid synthase family protein [Rhizomicrobium sp.]|jgi:cyclopropane-fatty-acyl-phospholipid synthase|nr:cyclopropane-fatty-acyl-phospholipid synthase family protein [Rhizomicrobium sp.]
MTDEAFTLHDNPTDIAPPLWGRMLAQFAQRISDGELVLRFANGAERVVRSLRPGPTAVIEFARARALPRILFGGAIGLAESYIHGEWSSPDLAAVIAFGARNMSNLGDKLNESPPLRLVHAIKHKLRPNTRIGSKRNIAAHYDLGNKFYEQWLDPSMTYSSALYERESMSLEDAQIAKWRRIAELIDLKADHHVLEIGCGWGGFALFAAKEFGCRVTAITVSQAQFARAREAVAAGGLSHRVEIRLEDYRDVQGQFDRIVSIEMFEAVGEENWPQFFGAMRERLTPGGIAALQIITIPDERFAQYRGGADFIQLYIFPGGMLPCPAAISTAARNAGFAIETARTFAGSYAQTLKEWRERFDAQWPAISMQGFDDRFRRMWQYYLAYCEGGFRAGAIDVAQFRLTRA